MNGNRLNALNELSFGEICLETNAVYKLCTAACLPDICPRVVDTQGRFACNALAYVLTQIHRQELKTALKNEHLCISGIDAMSFSETAIKGGNDVAHEMLTLCSTCKVPARGSGNPERKSYKLCSYRYAANPNALPGRRARGNARKKVASVTISLEAVYDMLALYAPSSHSGFWEQVGAGMVEAYEKRDFEEGNAFGQCSTEEGEEQRPIPRLLFTLDLNGDPVRSLILEATAAIEPLNELWFNKCALNGETYRCSAPLYYGGVVKKAMSEEAPEGAYDKRHVTESSQGRRGTFHGPRLNVYSSGYSGVPVKNMSSFCTTRTVYHQHEIHLTADRGRSGHLFELEEDWEWKDAAEAFNQVHGDDAFSVDMLKRDYAATMMIAKGESITSRPTELANLVAMIRTLRESNGGASLALRKCAARGSDTQEHRGRRRPAGESPSGSSQARKRTSAHSSRGSATGKRAKKTRRFEEFDTLGD
ncbi:hypothetical protein KUCAC02_025121 [Chaenocephalus aceratus]|nr:hypothetical protein KUCAC02_025121 [Chaenocephalus aceratus]